MLWFSGAKLPAGVPPLPPKFNSKPAPMFWSSREYMISAPRSKFLTGFQTVRVPTPQTMKSGLQPRTAPVAKFGVAPSAVRTGPAGDEQKIAFAPEVGSPG